MLVRVCLCEQARAIGPPGCKGEFLRIQEGCIIFPGSERANHCSWSQLNVIWGACGHSRSVSALAGSPGQTGLCWKHSNNHQCCAQVKLSFWPSLKRTRRMFLANLQTWSYKCVSVMWTHESSISLVAFSLSWRLMAQSCAGYEWSGKVSYTFLFPRVPSRPA